MRNCTSCDGALKSRYQVKFCSNKCQADYQYQQWVILWKAGEMNGGIGITSRNLSGHLKRYLMDKFENKCSQCSWNKRHPVTHSIPLEIDHIDGDAENNVEINLRLLCPNCHALTPYYKNLNRGKGRKWRMKKYIKNGS